MAKKIVEDMELDMENINQVETLVEVEKQTPPNRRTRAAKPKESLPEDGELINCLQNKKVIVRHIPKESGLITNSKHIYFGGMAENAVRYFTVPMLQSGKFVNVLTSNEKEYLEEVMGLEVNSLSVYRKEDNYWENYKIRLTKQDTILDLSFPEDYISYKVLLANKNKIAPNIQELQDRPKATYQFVLVEEGQEVNRAKQNMTYTMEAYLEFGKIQDNLPKLKTLVEIIGGRPVADNSTVTFLQTKINELIQKDPKIFLATVQDVYFDYKVLIKQAIKERLIISRGNFLYLKADGSPLCSDSQEPTLSIAAAYLALPKNQDLKFTLEAKIEKSLK